MGKRSRSKGAAWEREVSRELSALWPEANRGGHMQRRGTPDAADVEGTPWHVECKVGARPNVWAAIEQAEAQREATGDTRPPLVVAKRNSPGGSKPASVLVAVWWSDFCTHLAGGAEQQARASHEGRRPRVWAIIEAQDEQRTKGVVAVALVTRLDADGMAAESLAIMRLSDFLTLAGGE